jgi:hypothetical protein
MLERYGIRKPVGRVFVNPSGDATYSLPAFRQGYLVCFREGERTGKPFLDVNHPWKHDNLVMGRTNLYREINLTDIVNRIAEASLGGACPWGVVFTHSVTNGKYGYEFAVFRAYMDHIASEFGKNGRDNLWMATDEEVLEYLLLKDAFIVKTDVHDREVTIGFSGEISGGFRFYNMTLLAEAGGEIAEIRVTGADRFSYNGTGQRKAMINLSWDP